MINNADFSLDTGGFEGGVSKFGGFVGNLPSQINIDSGLFDSAVTDFNTSVEGFGRTDFGLLNTVVSNLANARPVITIRTESTINVPAIQIETTGGGKTTTEVITAPYVDNFEFEGEVNIFSF